MFSYFQKQCTKNKPENAATVPEIIGQRYSREARRRKDDLKYHKFLVEDFADRRR